MKMEPADASGNGGTRVTTDEEDFTDFKTRRLRWGGCLASLGA